MFIIAGSAYLLALGRHPCFESAVEAGRGRRRKHDQGRSQAADHLRWDHSGDSGLDRGKGFGGCGCLRNGGIRSWRSLWTVPGAERVIETLRKQLEGVLLVGAGTVLNPRAPNAVLMLALNLSSLRD